MTTTHIAQVGWLTAFGAALGLTGCATTVMTRSEITIAKPRAEVFAYLADFENMPRWNYYVTHVERRTAGKTALGTVFHQIRKSDAQDYRVVELDPPHQIAVATLPPERPLTLRFVLDEVDGGTRLLETWTLDAGAAGRLAGPLLSRRIGRAVQVNLGVLKHLLEDGQATLPDGRRVTR